jgi:lipopolysaccharide export system permease protein
MRTIDRYLTGIFIRNFALTLLGLTSVFVFQAMLTQLIDREFPASQVIFYHFLGVPRIMTQFAPPAVMIATLMTLSGLNRTQELVACYSIGIGLPRIASVLLSLAFMVSCALLVSQDRLVPPLHRYQTIYYQREMKKRQDFMLDFKQDRIWYRSRNLIYNLRTFDPKKNIIYGMAIYTFDEDFNLVQVVDAQKAVHSQGAWKLLDGSVTVFAQDDSSPLTQGFKEKKLDLSESPKDFTEVEREVDGLRLKELYRYVQKSRQAGADTKSNEVKFHSRISLSFVPLVMCVLAFPFAVRNRREGGVARDLALCLVITFFYWLFYSIGLSLGSNGALPPLLAAWLPSAVFGAIALGMLTQLRT